MRWFYDHYARTPADCDDWRMSPLRAPDLAGLAARGRGHRRVRPAARPGRGVRASGCATRACRPQACAPTGCSTASSAMHEFLPPRAGGVGRRGRRAPRRARDGLTMPLHPQAQSVCDLDQRGAVDDRARATDGARSRARVGACYLAMAGGEPEPMFAVEDRDADGVPVRVYRPSPDDDLPSSCTSTAAAGRSAASSSTTRSRASSRTRRARSSCRSTTGSRPSIRSRRRSTTAGARCSGPRRTRPSSAATPSRIAVGGDSAGGNLAAVCALRARDAGGPDLALQVLDVPGDPTATSTPASYVEQRRRATCSTREQMQWFFDCYTSGGADPADWQISPLRARRPARRRARGRASPPSTTRCATRARRTPTGCATPVCRSSTSRYDGMIHAFFGLSGAFDASRDAIGLVGDRAAPRVRYARHLTWQSSTSPVSSPI